MSQFQISHFSREECPWGIPPFPPLLPPPPFIRAWWLTIEKLTPLLITQKCALLESLIIQSVIKKFIFWLVELFSPQYCLIYPKSCGHFPFRGQSWWKSTSKIHRNTSKPSDRHKWRISPSNTNCWNVLNGALRMAIMETKNLSEIPAYKYSLMRQSHH